MTCRNVLGIAISVMLVTGHASAQVQYSVTHLGSLGGYGTATDGSGQAINSFARGINAAGQIVGYADTSGGSQHAFIYSNSTMTDLGTLGSGVNSYAQGINASGQIVGYADTSSGSQHAFIYNHGALTDLGTFPGSTQSYAFAINAAGQIVGQASTNGVYEPFLYSNGAMINLGNLPGGTGGSAYGINDSGQIVGVTYGGPIAIPGAILTRASLQAVATPDSSGIAADHAFMYSQGTMTDLGILPGAGTYAETWAFAINAGGQIVGQATPPGSAVLYAAFLYGNGAMANLGSLGGLTASANGINNKLQAVGTFNTHPPYTHGFLYDNGTMCDLNSLLAPGSGWTITSAEAINDNGWIAANGFNPTVDHGFGEALLLIPAPEPATIGILGLGVAGLLLLRIGPRPPSWRATCRAGRAPLGMFA